MFKILLVPMITLSTDVQDIIINETDTDMILLLKTKHTLSTDVQDIISTYDIVIINKTPLVSRCSR